MKICLESIGFEVVQWDILICKTYCSGSQIKMMWYSNLSAVIVAWVLPKCYCQVLSFVTWPRIFLVCSVLETVSSKKQRKLADERENERNGKKSQTIKLKVKSSKKKQDPKYEQLSSKPAFLLPLVWCGAGSFPIRNCRTCFCCCRAL